MIFAFYTLGCKTNQYETQAMERLLTEMGHSLGRFDEDCDGYQIRYSLKKSMKGARTVTVKGYKVTSKKVRKLKSKKKLKRL